MAEAKKECWAWHSQEGTVRKHCFDTTDEKAAKKPIFLSKAELQAADNNNRWTRTTPLIEKELAQMNEAKKNS